MWVEQLAEQLVLTVLGLCAGMSVASGVFTVFTAVGLVPRFAEHTDSADHIMTYENMIISGCFLGNLFSLFVEKLLEANYSLPVIGIPVVWQKGLLAVIGLFVGIYVGTLAVSIAELLDAIPIMAHRMKLKRGVGLVIAGLAVGKLVGSLFYYMEGVFMW
nr:stage V sporulation protein AB [Lachnospiraceae bacterium]